MRVIALALASMLSTVLLIGGALLLIRSAPHRDTGGGLILLASGSLAILVFAPVFVGAISLYSGVDRTGGAVHAHRRLLILIGGLEAFGVGGIVVYTAIVGAPAWLPIVFIGSAMLLLTASILAARALRAGAGPVPDPVPWAPIAPAVIRGKVRAMVITVVVAFVVTFVVTGALASVVVLRFDDSSARWGTAALLAVVCAGLAGGLAGLIVARPILLSVQDLVGGDIALSRMLNRVVLQGRAAELDAVGLMAVKFAVATRLALRFQLASILLILGSITLAQLPRAFVPDSADFVRLLFVVLCGLTVVIVSIVIVQLRRAERYVKEHADPTDGSSGVG